MQIDANACQVFWMGYLSQLPQDHAHRALKPDAFAFGGEGALANELAELVLCGKKCATTSLAIEFTSLSEPLPTIGSLSIILRGDLTPVAIIERSAVTIVPFESVAVEYAAIEGEGDGSLAHWREAHTEYFTDVCARLGGRFDARTPVICQEFQLRWPCPR
jgi:uncharacterized protein YhfF